MLQLNKKEAENIPLCYSLATKQNPEHKGVSAMANITQDMLFRLSLINYAKKNSELPKLPSNTIPTGNTSTAG